MATPGPPPLSLQSFTAPDLEDAAEPPAVPEMALQVLAYFTRPSPEAVFGVLVIVVEDAGKDVKERPGQARYNLDASKSAVFQAVLQPPQ